MADAAGLADHQIGGVLGYGLQASRGAVIAAVVNAVVNAGACLRGRYAAAHGVDGGVQGNGRQVLQAVFLRPLQGGVAHYDLRAQLHELRLQLGNFALVRIYQRGAAPLQRTAAAQQHAVFLGKRVVVAGVVGHGAQAFRGEDRWLCILNENGLHLQ